MPPSFQNTASPHSALEGNGIATTNLSLGSELVNYATEAPDPPKSCQDISQYNLERIKVGLTYADRTLQNHSRQLSPIGIRALILYRDACARSLELEDRDVFDQDEKMVRTLRDQSIGFIKAYEDRITFRMSLQTIRSTDAQILQDEILKLQRASFHARYVEVFASMCQRIGKMSAARKFASWQASGNGYCVDVNCKLQDKNEKAAYALVQKGGGALGECPTHKATSQSCNRLGLETEEILAMIQHYAILDELPDVNLLTLIKSERYQDLKRRLRDDICNIPLIFPTEEVLQTSLMAIILEGMIDIWFCRNPYQPDDIEKCIPSKGLRRHYWELQGAHAQSDGVEIYQEVSDAIMLCIWRRFLDQQQKQEVKSMKQDSLGLAWGQRKRKRAEARQIIVENFRTRQRYERFHQLIRLASNFKRTSDVYRGVGMPTDELFEDPIHVLNKEIERRVT